MPTLGEWIKLRRHRHAEFEDYEIGMLVKIYTRRVLSVGFEMVDQKMFCVKVKADMITDLSGKPTRFIERRKPSVRHYPWHMLQELTQLEMNLLVLEIWDGEVSGC